MAKSEDCGGLMLFKNIADIVNNPNFCNKTFGKELMKVLTLLSCKIILHKIYSTFFLSSAVHKFVSYSNQFKFQTFFIVIHRSNESLYYFPR